MQRLAYFLVAYGLKNHLTAFINPGLFLKLLGNLWICILSCTLIRNETWCLKSSEEFGYNPVWRFARVAVINGPQTGWFRTMGVYCLTVLEVCKSENKVSAVRSLCALSESSRGGSFFASSSFWGGSGHRCCSLSRSHVTLLSLSSRGILPEGLCPNFPLLGRTPFTGIGPSCSRMTST